MEKRTDEEERIKCRSGTDSESLKFWATIPSNRREEVFMSRCKMCVRTLGCWGVCPRSPTRFFKPTKTVTEMLATGFMKSLLQRRENNIERKQKQSCYYQLLGFLRTSVCSHSFAKPVTFFISWYWCRIFMGVTCKKLGAFVHGPACWSSPVNFRGCLDRSRCCRPSGWRDLEQTSRLHHWSAANPDTQSDVKQITTKESKLTLYRRSAFWNQNFTGKEECILLLDEERRSDLSRSQTRCPRDARARVPNPLRFCRRVHPRQSNQRKLISRTAMNPKENVLVLQKLVVGLRLPLAIIDPSSIRNPPY